MVRRFRNASGALCLAASLLSPSAWAQAPAENVAAARSLGVQGIRLAESGKCDEALEKLERAEALYHAPSILGRLGECQVQVGRIVLGTENLNRVVREQLAPNAPLAFREAQARARRVLEQALPRIAYLIVHVAPKDVTATVSIDDASVPPALIDAERPTDPGTHAVTASAAGYLSVTANVSLADGARQELTLTLVPDPSLAKAAEASPAPAPPVSKAPGSDRTRAPGRTLAYVALGVGGAGLIVGSVSGLLAISNKNSLDCPDRRCTGEQRDDLDSAKSMALTSSIGFGVGLVGAVLGTVLLLSGSTEQSVAEVALGGLHARPFVGARSAGIRGFF